MVVRQLDFDAGAGRIAIVGGVGRGNVTVGAGIGARNEPIQQLQRRRTQSRHRDPIVRKRQPGERIADVVLPKSPARCASERTTTRTCCRVIAVAFVVSEPEHPALDDGSARHCRRTGSASTSASRRWRREDVARLQRVVAVELPGSAVQLVGARPRDHVHDRPRVAAEFGAVRVRLDLELLDRVRRRPHDEAGIERVVVARAVEEKVVRLGPHAVDAEAGRRRAESSRRGIARPRRRAPGRRDHPGTSVPSWVKLRPFSGSSTSFWWSIVMPERRVGGFDQRCLRPDGHALRDAADGELAGRPASCRRPTRALSPARPA